MKSVSAQNRNARAQDGDEGLAGRVRRWSRPPRRLRFTRMGKWYVAFTLALGFAAINTGNNLLFLLLGLLLAGIVLSGVLSEATLRGLHVERLLPEDATAGAPVLVGLKVTNAKARAGAWAVVARDVTADGEAGRAFVLRLGARESREASYLWTPARRGRVTFVRVELATLFPFGLFEKWREVDLPDERVVFPRQVPAPPLAARNALPEGDRPTGRTGPGLEFFALRDARPDDDARAIHWRTSARRGRPVVVERERERRRRVSVVLDNRGADARALDDAVEQAAALVRRAMREECEVSVAVSGEAVAAGGGPAHERRILRALALLETAGLRALPPAEPVRGDVIRVVVAPQRSGRAAEAA